MTEESELDGDVVIRQVGSVLKAFAEIRFKSFVGVLSGHGNQTAGPERMRHSDRRVADTVKEFSGIAVKVFIKSDVAETRTVKTDFIGYAVKSFCNLGVDGSFILMRVENNFT